MPPPDAETVQVIPGSKLIWKITPRPENSAKVWPMKGDQTQGRLLPGIKNSLSICLTQFYAFSTFAMQLNELEKSTEGAVPPTDSRLRPDIRALENGDIGSLSASHFSRIGKISWAAGCVSTCIPTVVELASAEKKRLEEKQRMARKNRSKSTEDWKTRQVQGPSCAAWALFLRALIVALLLSCLPTAIIPLWYSIRNAAPGPRSGSHRCCVDCVVTVKCCATAPPSVQAE